MKLSIKICSLLFVIVLHTSCEKISQEIKNRAPITQMQVIDPIRHYYPVVRGEKLPISYKFINKGEHPLVLKEIQASCGCIITEFSEKAIKPNGTGYINLIYDSSKNIGFVEHYLLIVANVDNPYTNEVNFSTNVVPDPLYIKDYEQIYQEQAKENVERWADGKSKLRYYVPDEQNNNYP